MPKPISSSPVSLQNALGTFVEDIVFVDHFLFTAVTHAAPPFIAVPVDILPQFLPNQQDTICPYRLDHGKGTFITRPFMLYAPSLLGLWALNRQQQNPLLIRQIISDLDCNKSGFWFFLRLRFLWERFRLGSDAVSLYAQQKLARYGIQAKLSITQWLEWLDKAKNNRLQTIMTPMPSSQKDWDDLFFTLQENEQT